MDDIDALIATELDEHGVPLDDYSADRYDKCELCHDHWHGLPNGVECPGAWASDEVKESWRRLGYSKSVDTQPFPYLPDSYECVGEAVNGRVEAIYHDPQGHDVRVTLAAIFVADPTGSDAQPRGHIADLLQFDELHQVNTGIECDWPTESSDSVGFQPGGTIQDEQDEWANAWEAIAGQHITDMIQSISDHDDTP